MNAWRVAPDILLEHSLLLCESERMIRPSTRVPLFGNHCFADYSSTTTLLFVQQDLLEHLIKRTQIANNALHCLYFKV